MAIVTYRPKSLPSQYMSAKSLPSQYMSVEQFRQWLKHIDTNGDGKISKKELEEALREYGFRFARWRAWRAITHSDVNGNGHIDIGDLETTELLKYAQKRWGITITP